jgi:type I restriction enzyme S subunit
VSYPRYPAYKHSGVEWLGEVPEHWVVTRLKNVSSIRVSTVDKHVLDDELPVHVCHYVQAYYNERITNAITFVEGSATPREVADFSLRLNDVVITKDSETPDDIAVATLVAEDVPNLVCGYHLAILRPHLEVLDGSFLYYLQKSQPLRAYYTVTARGVTRYGLSYGGLASSPVLRPPLPEQRAIADFLDGETARVDALVAKQEALIALLQEKRKAVISHAVTKGLNPDAPMKDSGVAWLGEVPAGWDVQPLKRIARRIDVGIAAAAVHAYADSGVPILRSMNVRPNLIGGELIYITDDFAEQNKSKYLFAGDILTVRTGHAGVSAVVPAHLDRSHCFTMLMTTLSVSAIPEYICQYMNCAPAIAHFQSEGWGAAQPNISVPILQMLSVPVPPIKEQQQIVAYLDHETARIDALIAKAEQFIERLREHRTALIAAAVTGKIDVRTLTPQPPLPGAGEGE